MEELMELLQALKPEIDFETEKELIDDGLLESFDVITLIAEIEDQFGVEIPAEEIVPENLNSAEGILNLIRRSERKSEMEFRDLKKQYQVLKPEIDAAIGQVLEESAYIGGKPVAQLEAELAEYVGVKHCIACANGTDALTLALMAWGIGEGDAVFVPDFTFFSSAETVAYEGATRYLPTILEDTFNMDPDSLERAVQAVLAEGKLKPRVIVAVDLFDCPQIMSGSGRLRTVTACIFWKTRPRDLEEVSVADGQEVSAISRLTSFFPAKPLGCYGDGGAVFTDNDEWAELIRSLRIHGKGTDKYDNVRIGMNSRLDTIQAAVLRVKLKAFREYD